MVATQQVLENNYIGDLVTERLIVVAFYAKATMTNAKSSSP
jgi:hypothetical protein